MGQECSEEAVRLVNTEAENEGVVEVCLNDQWNTICGYRWDFPEAIVTCRELGFKCM